MARFYSVTEAANVLQISRQRVQQLIDAKRMRAIKVGNTWMITELTVAPIKNPKKAGFKWNKAQE